MTDGDNTQQTHNKQDRNGRGAEAEPHRVHLLEAEREPLAECHRYGVYLALCGAVLAVLELESSWCEEQPCERVIIYCLDCVREAASHNAEALAASPARDGGTGAR